MRTRIECCKGCNKRKQNCHAACEDYRRESKELDELRNTIKAEKNDHSSYVGYMHRSIQHRGGTIKHHVKGSGK